MIASSRSAGHFANKLRFLPAQRYQQGSTSSLCRCEVNPAPFPTAMPTSTGESGTNTRTGKMIQIDWMFPAMRRHVMRRSELAATRRRTAPTCRFDDPSKAARLHLTNHGTTHPGHVAQDAMQCLELMPPFFTPGRRRPAGRHETVCPRLGFDSDPGPGFVDIILWGNALLQGMSPCAPIWLGVPSGCRVLLCPCPCR
jgi:hypothetical protein